MKKTIRQLLSELPECYRERAIQNALNDEGGLGIDRLLEGPFKHSPSDAIGSSFIWMDTPEGHDFWEAVDRHFQDPSNPLPPLPNE